jgi:site-specific DNA-methyltransferase (adenine-specific)
MAKVTNIQIEYINIDKLTPYQKNTRKHGTEDVKKIAKSISKHGMCDPIGVWGEENIIVEGHGRYAACKSLGIEIVPVLRLDEMTDKQRREYAIAHNRTAEFSEWDFDMLKEESKELDFSDFDFDLTEEDDTEIIEDDAPEVDDENEPITRLGDIWQLGRHRLMCGDSTDKDAVLKLISGAEIDMVFTDPPYNVAFNGRSGKFDVIENDDLADDDFDEFISSVCEMIKFINPNNYYVWCNWKFYATLQTKLDFKSCIVWAKNVFGLGKGYRHQHEFCLFNGEIDDSIKNESDLWEIAKDTNYVHPTQKPVALIGRALKNHKAVKNVLDLFGGSGSSLMGCEQLDRTCYTMELDPKYCDVIIKRWEALTGQKAVLL